MAAAGIAGVGRGQWMKSQGFLEGGHCIRTPVLHPRQSTVFLKSKSSYHQHSHWNPQMILQLILSANNRLWLPKMHGHTKNHRTKMSQPCDKTAFANTVLAEPSKVEASRVPVASWERKAETIQILYDEEWEMSSKIASALVPSDLCCFRGKHCETAWSKGVEHKELSWAQHPKQCAPTPLWDAALGKSGQLCKGTVNALLLSFQSTH